MTLPKFMRRSIPRSQRGQSLVEFALTLPALIILLGGVLDLGRVYFVYNALTDAAGEGALFLSISPTCYETNGGGAGTCADPSNLTYRMRNAAGTQGNSLIDFSNLTRTVCYVDGNTFTYYCKRQSGSTLFSIATNTWSNSIDVASGTATYDVTADVDPTSGDQVIVRLRYDFILLTPVISQIIGNTTLPLTIQASQNIVSK